MPPVKHALLSASSASRWLVCTAAPRFEEGLPESTSEYAEEGRLAHAIGELKVTKKCTPMSTRTYNTRLNKLKKNPLYDPEMDKTTDLYLEHITEQVMDYDSAPTVAVEVRVDFSDYVPEGFGTCDCCIIGGDLLSITDYKHGKGVPVSAVGNPQMRLYALGALHRYTERSLHMDLWPLLTNELESTGGVIGAGPLEYRATLEIYPYEQEESGNA